ncbi:MAG: hypothetical protein ACO376_06990, partial [Gammaproteobacteria bacterium]
MRDVLHDKCRMCENRARYSDTGEAPAVFCKEHKTEGMKDVDYQYQMCACGNGRKVASFPGKTPKVCSRCMEIGMIAYSDMLCIACCAQRATWGLKTDRKITHCGECAKEVDGMISVQGGHCNHEMTASPSCPLVFTRASDGKTFCPSNGLFKNDEDGLTYCVKHRGEKYKSRPRSHCVHPGCTKERTYRLIGDTSPLYCGPHAKEVGARENRAYVLHSLDKKSKCPCGKLATHWPLVQGVDREVSREGGRCGECKTADMYLHKPFCSHPSCLIQQPAYKSDVGDFCKKHAPTDAKSNQKRRCIGEGCDATQPQFNVPTLKSGKYCSKCKTEEMVNVVHTTEKKRCGRRFAGKRSRCK